MGHNQNETPHGRWVRRRPELHDCVLPSIEDAHDGDAWECGSCHMVWVVEPDVNGESLLRRTGGPATWGGWTTTTSYSPASWGYGPATWSYWERNQYGESTRPEPEQDGELDDGKS